MLTYTQCIVECLVGAFTGRWGVSKPVDDASIEVVFPGDGESYLVPFDSVKVVCDVKDMRELLAVADRLALPT